MPATAPNQPAEPSSLKEKVRRLPDKPGVYLMKDRLGRIIYVGKAKSLRRRVSSYFTPSRAMTWHPKIRALIDLIADLEVIEVRSEPEALLLEGRLIKQWRPRYNTDFTGRRHRGPAALSADSGEGGRALALLRPVCAFRSAP